MPILTPEKPRWSDHAAPITAQQELDRTAQLLDAVHRAETEVECARYAILTSGSPLNLEKFRAATDELEALRACLDRRLSVP